MNDYSEEEIQATWYNDDDFRLMHEEISFTIKLVVSGKPMNKKAYCSRGLEFATPKLSQQRFQNKAVARDAVLDEQAAQYCSGIHDGERLAQIYQASNYHCQVVATLVGLEDEKKASSLSRKKYRAQLPQNSSRRSCVRRVSCRVP